MFDFFSRTADYDIILGEFGMFNKQWACGTEHLKNYYKQRDLLEQLFKKLGGNENENLATEINDLSSQNKVLGTVSWALSSITNVFPLTTTDETAEFLFNTTFLP
jgi:hypothetical protein